jgi:hypothetical protein
MSLNISGIKIDSKDEQGKKEKKDVGEGQE